jgi:hypothetical protein
MGDVTAQCSYQRLLAGVRTHSPRRRRVVLNSVREGDMRLVDSAHLDFVSRVEHDETRLALPRSTQIRSGCPLGGVKENASFHVDRDPHATRLLADDEFGANRIDVTLGSELCF